MPGSVSEKSQSCGPSGLSPHVCGMQLRGLAGTDQDRRVVSCRRSLGGVEAGDEMTKVLDNSLGALPLAAQRPHRHMHRHRHRRLRLRHGTGTHRRSSRRRYQPRGGSRTNFPPGRLGAGASRSGSCRCQRLRAAAAARAHTETRCAIARDREYGV